MRAGAAVIILLVVGVVLTVHVLVGDRTLSPSQLEKVRTVCPECHGEVPEYDRAIRVHNKHAAFDCSFCHQDERGLKTADRVHGVLEGVGLGAMLFALLGIITNMSIIARKGKAG